MKVYEIQESFGIENLKVAERPDPKAGPGQVVVKVQSTSINYRDMLMVIGHYNPKQPLPLVPFSDGAGEVADIGDGVSRVAVGDRVAGCFFQGWIGGAPTAATTQMAALGSPLDGMLAEYVVLDAEGVVKVPYH